MQRRLLIILTLLLTLVAMGQTQSLLATAVNNPVLSAVTPASLAELYLRPLDASDSPRLSSLNTRSEMPDQELATRGDVVRTPVAPVQPTNGSKTILGYATYDYAGDQASYQSMMQYNSSLTDLATHTFLTDGAGNLRGLVPSQQIAYANNQGIRTLAMVSNNFSGDIARAVLTNAGNRQTLITNIEHELSAYYYQGVNIDFEGIYPSDGVAYTTFLRELYSRLHAAGYAVTIAVPAKLSGGSADEWNGAYDFPAIGNYADQVVIMTYDEHWSGGAAGPVASLNWVERAVDYAISVIPRDKVLLGVAAYGYDWSSTGSKAYSINGCYDLAARYGATSRWDEVSQTPYFNYMDGNGIPHVVWFESSRSLGLKLDLGNRHDLGGIAIWRLGLENTDYWSILNAKMR